MVGWWLEVLRRGVWKGYQAKAAESGLWGLFIEFSFVAALNVV